MSYLNTLAFFSSFKLIVTARGIASHFLRPLLFLVGSRLGSSLSLRFTPPGEGIGVGWLRNWIRGLMSGFPAIART